jgi:alkyldihydroxyacetonephosphate synthase
MVATGKRSFWGWGYADAALPDSSVAQAKTLVKLALGLDHLRDIEPPALETLQLREPRFRLSDGLKAICSAATEDRASHSYGKAYRDVIRGLRGQFDNPPDYVAFPRTEAQIQQLIAFCSEQAVALIPYGGGSSVVGGIEPTCSPQYQGVITCDMQHFDQIVSVDHLSRTAHIQAGIYGPALEAGLKPHGYTLRHFPQSFEFSTLGGWIATRAGGHFSTHYTHIDDFVQSVRTITPQGIAETRGLPGSGAGPDPNRLWLGSEGVLGIITAATLRLQTIPTYRASAVVHFEDEAAGVEAVRLISQSELFPSNCRLISALESFAMGIGNGQHLVLLLGFEAHSHTQKPKLDHALEICQQCQGQPRDVTVLDGTPPEHSETASTWRGNFMRAPYLRDALIRSGLLVETFETAVTWDKFAHFHQQIMEQTFSAMTQQCGKGLLYWRFTHVYPDGPAPYYTVIAPAKAGEEVAQWDAIKTAASDAIIANGGTITHHHAVGKDHRQWYQQQSGTIYNHVLRETKQMLDPQWILNPDVLLALKNGDASS